MVNRSWIFLFSLIACVYRIMQTIYLADTTKFIKERSKFSFKIALFSVLFSSCSTDDASFHNDVRDSDTLQVFDAIQVSDALQVLEQSVIWSPESWTSICWSTFCQRPSPSALGSLHNSKPSIYAKAIGDAVSTDRTPPDNERCSGFLVDNEWFVTADHCKWYGDPQNVRFGRYANPLQASHTSGLAEARKRYRQFIGASDALMGDELFTNFNCYFWTSANIDEDRDYKFYYCDPHISPEGIRFQPGDLYGHINVESRKLYEGETIYSASVHQTNSDVTQGVDRHILISDGTVYDDDDGCTSSSWSHCFETKGADQLCGSSGGPIMTPSGRAVGVIHGLNSWTVDHCDRTTISTRDAWKTANAGTYLTSKINNEYANTNPRISTGFISGPLSFSEPLWVGGFTGTRYEQNCPEKYYAAGIIGSTAYSGYVGNFGIVCVPFNKSLLARELDRAQVIAGGSVGTHFGIKTEDLNTYYNDFYSKESAVYTGVNVFKSQNVQMCRPGYGLTGLLVRIGTAGRIQKIEGIHCHSFLYSGAFDYFQLFNNQSLVEENIGGQGSNSNNVLWLQCERTTVSERTMVKGLKIRSGWETDGLGFNCAPY